MHEYFHFIRNNHNIFMFIITVLGIIVGSFLNVIIYRWPIIIEREYRAECYKALDIRNTQKNNIEYSYFSVCPNCKHIISWFYNIPILSFILLRRKCAYCKKEISWQYPIVESISGVLSFLIAYRFGYSWQTLSLLLFMFLMLIASAIDCKKLFIPDQVVFFTLFLGLFGSCFRLFVNSEQAIYGSIAGYLLLFVVAKVFKMVAKIDGLGEGDLMLLAAIGTWTGIEGILHVVLIASMLGLIYGIFFLKITKKNYRTPIPFGPFLSFAGFITILYKSKLLGYSSVLFGLF